MKQKARMGICLALLILTCMIVSPVFAKYTITGEPLGGDAHLSEGKITDLVIDASVDGNAVQRISVDLSTGSVINFTLWYGSGSSVSGWMVYANDGFFTQHTEVALNKVVSGYDYTGLQEIGKVDIVGYARNETSSGVYDTGFIVYDTTFGLTDLNRGVVFYPVPSITDNVIYKFELHSTRPVNVFWYTNTRANVGRSVGHDLIQTAQDWINFALELASFLKDTVVSIFTWIKFFFWDNLLMTLALYLTLTMVFAARASRGNPAIFLRRWFKDQVGFFNFIIGLWRVLVEIIGTFRGIFRI